MYEYKFNKIHDCFVDVFNRAPTREEVYFIGRQLPKNIILLAEQWGWNDTEVGDFTYKWIEDNKELINN